MTTLIGCIRKKEKWINISYYVLYAILYLSALVGTTTFMGWEGVPRVRNLFYMGATAGMCALWMLGIVLQESWKVNVAKVVILLVGILQFAIGGGSSLILILTILIGATDRKSADIILKESMIIGILILFIAYVASKHGYIEYKVSGDGRHSFGFIYYSHFSDKLLYLYMMFRCLYHKRLSIAGYALSLILVYLDFRYTHARTVTICFVLFLLLCGVYDFMSFIREKRGKTAANQTHGSSRALNESVLKMIGILTSATYLFASVLSFWGIYLYRLMGNRKIPDELRTFVARLQLSSDAMKQYGFTLFGQKIYESINGGPYFYLDNSYIRLFFITGAVTLAFFVAYMAWLMWRMFSEKHYILFFVLFVAAIGGLSETYTINFYYNVFAILAFARLGCMGTISEREKTT